MAVVAITGKLSSGKSTVLRLLKKKGARVFSADKKVHQLYRNKKSKVYKKVACLFPEVMCGGSISRRRLGTIIFCDSDRRRCLEHIIHPVVIDELRSWIASVRRKKAVSVAEVPLLFEKRLQAYFDYTVLVTAPQDTLLERIKEKYSLSAAAALKRLRASLPDRQKRKMVDFIVDNSADMKQLQKEVELLWKKLRQKQKPTKKRP